MKSKLDKYTDYTPYIEKAEKSVFRYEGLQDYSAEDGEESIKHFIETGELNIHSTDTEWWQMIKEKNDAGVKTCRVRMVKRPLNDYTKWELALHKESAEFSGEDIRIIEEAPLGTIKKDLSDFYLIESTHLFILKYGPKGKYLGSVLIEDNKKVDEYVKYSQELIKNSVSIPLVP
ncbi:MAG: DUF6879 family protein [Patescibacteria group bacterium]